MEEENIPINSKINEKEIKLLKKLDNVYDIPKILNKTLWKSLAPFEESKMTYIFKQKSDSEAEIVVKIRQNIYGEQDDKYFTNFNEVIHEAFIGLFGISKLSDRNYSKCFAKVISAKPEEICTPFVEQFTEFDKPCSYVVYEFIPGMTLRDYITTQNPSTKKLKSIYLTLFKALHYANREINFTHYDLHLSNIIIYQESTNETSSHQRNEIYPVLIDYGSSHIKHKDQDYGLELDIGNIHNKSMWYHDIIKVLLFSYRELSQDEQYGKIIIFQDNYTKLRQLYINEKYPKERNDEVEQAIKELKQLEHEVGLKMIGLSSRQSKDLFVRNQQRTKFRNEQKRERNKLYDIILPVRNYGFEDKIVQLLEYFFPDFDYNFFLDYEMEYLYFQAPDEIKFDTNFDKFIEYAEQILK